MRLVLNIHVKKGPFGNFSSFEGDFDQTGNIPYGRLGSGILNNYHVTTLSFKSL